MSSHHFVKEGQEPALLIADGFSYQSVESLLEWAPLVMVLEPALDVVLSWGIKIDVVIANIEAVEMIREKTMDQFPIEVLGYNQNENLLSAALGELSEDQNAVHVITHISNETFKLAQSFHKNLDMVLFDETTKWSLAKGKFEKWIPALTELSLQKNSDTQEFILHGLAHINNNLLRATHDGEAVIESSFPFWIGERYA